MGSTYSAIRLLNRERTAPEQLGAFLVKYFTRKGLVPAEEANADFSCRAAFSGGSDWVTVCSREYGLGGEPLLADAKGLAKALKTHCVITSVYDSDVVWLELFGPTAKQRDTAAAGHPEILAEIMEGKPVPRGKEKQWLPLLREGATWGQLTKAWSDVEVFAEEALANMAPLLGMDPAQLGADYSDWDELTPGAGRVVTLHFKAAEPEPVFLQEGPAKLSLSCYPNYISGEGQAVGFRNEGGVSKGLTILLLGECFETGEAEITEIKIRRPKHMNASYAEPSDFEWFGAQPRPYVSGDGRKGFRADVEGYEFFPGLNMPYLRTVPKKLFDLLPRVETGVWLTLTVRSGEKHPFVFFVIPKQNWEGQSGQTLFLYRTKELLILEKQEEARQRMLEMQAWQQKEKKDEA